MNNCTMKGYAVLLPNTETLFNWKIFIVFLGQKTEKERMVAESYAIWYRLQLMHSCISIYL